MAKQWNLNCSPLALIMLVLAAVGIMGAAAPATAQTAATHQVTFTKDIAPLLQRSCQRCHRPDSVAPMSLLTYEQARPYARAMKERTARARVFGQRGAMPPWFVEKNIGIQKFKDDISLSDEEIQTFAAWADTGAPLGDLKDMPPALKLADTDVWTQGTPDLIVRSPMIFVPAIGTDWDGPLGAVPIGLKEDRYLKTQEYKEWSDFDVTKLPKGVYGARFVFHHNNVGIGDEFGVDPAGAGVESERRDDPLSVQSLPIHEIGRNGDVFSDDSGPLLPKNSTIVWTSNHVHSPGVPGTQRNARMDMGFRFQPRGYKPKYVTVGSGLGLFAMSEIDVLANTDNQRFDAYWVAATPVKMVNYEPHMHAGGIRMCIEAIYGRVTETLNCSGYDHNWLKTYYYDDNHAPLLPKGTILHAVNWIDNTAKNTNLVNTRNAQTWGASSVSNMVMIFNRVIELTDEQYKTEVKKREEYLLLTGEDRLACPECNLQPRFAAPSTATGGGSQ